MTSTQYAIPGSYLNESITAQYAVPGTYVNGRAPRAQSVSFSVAETSVITVGLTTPIIFSITETSAITCAVTRTRKVIDTITETSLLSFVTTRTRAINIFTVAETSTITFDTSGIKFITFTTAETSAITFAPVRARARNIFTIAETSQIHFTGKRARAISFTISEISTIIFDTLSTKFIAFEIDETSTITFAVNRFRKIIEHITETSSITFVGIRNRNIIFAINETSNIVFFIKTNSAVVWWFPVAEFDINVGKTITFRVNENSFIDFAPQHNIPVSFTVHETSNVAVRTNTNIGMLVNSTSNIAVNLVKTKRAGVWLAIENSFIHFTVSKPSSFVIRDSSTIAMATTRKRGVGKKINNVLVAFRVSAISSVFPRVIRLRKSIYSINETSAISLSDKRTRNVVVNISETSVMSLSATVTASPAATITITETSSITAVVARARKSQFSISETSAITASDKRSRSVIASTSETSAITFNPLVVTGTSLLVAETSSIVLVGQRNRRVSALVHETSTITARLAKNIKFAVRETATVSARVIVARRIRGAIGEISTITISGSGRNWLYGWYTQGISAPSPTSFIGLPPEIEYDASFEDPNFGDFAIIYQGNNGVTGYPTSLACALGPSGIENSSVDYAGAAAGNYDANYTNVANNVKNSGHVNSVRIIRIDPEFNINPDLGHINATQYKAAWNRCAQIWKTINPGIKTCWNPNATQAGDTARGAVGPYFPGVTWCDLIGIDVYSQSDFGITFDSMAGNTNGLEVGTLNWYAAQAISTWGNLPLVFPEWGDKYNSFVGDSTQITKALAWADAHNVVGMFWWNGTGAGAPLAAIGRTAIANGINNRPYGGTYWSTLPIPAMPGINP